RPPAADPPALLLPLPRAEGRLATCANVADDAEAGLRAAPTGAVLRSASVPLRTKSSLDNKETVMKRIWQNPKLGAIAIAAAFGLSAPQAQAQETFRIGIVSFLSGQAAESFGI